MKTSQSNLVEKGKANLTGERILKSFLCGFGVGLALSFVVGFITWFLDFKGLWLTIGLGVGACAVASVLFYFFVFRPTPRAVMERIDRAGLDERMITMLELQDDDSYIAARQREDAANVFQTAMKVNGGKLIKMKIPALIISLACAAGTIGIAAAVVTGLSDFGVIPTGMQLIRGEWEGPEDKVYTITYLVGEEGGGIIEGELSQTVKAGESTTAVKAIATKQDENGVSYYFKGWQDENGNFIKNTLLHSVSNVQASKEFTAVFEQVDPFADPEFNYYYDSNGDQSGSDNDGRPSDPNDEESGPPKPGDANPMPGPPGGSPTDSANSIIDGETPYEENFDSYNDDAMNSLVDGSNTRPPELNETIEGYFGIL